MSSWGEVVSSYRAEKRAEQGVVDPDAWKRNEYTSKRSYRDSRHNRKAEESEYDPIRHSFRRRERDKEERQREEARLARSITRAQAKSARQGFARSYDIIGHAEPLSNSSSRADVRRASRSRPPSTFTSYNILTGEKTGPDEQERQHRKPTLAAKVETRSFDILSNRYHHDHEAKSRRDREALVKEKEKAFWKERDYDPIQAKHYDDTKDEQERAAAEARRRDRERLYYARMPPSVRTSEGEGFNITSMEVKDERVMQHHKARQTGVKANRRMKYEAEERMRKEEEARQRRAQERAVGKVSHQRYNEMASRGYNIVSNVDFSGTRGQALPPPRSQPRGSAWEIIRKKRLYS